MRTLIPQDQVANTLAAWKDGKAEIFAYHVSHRRLAIRLARINEPKLLYLIATGCVRISGPVKWKPVDISISNQEFCKVMDCSAGFELICDGAYLMFVDSWDLDSTFDHLLDDV